MALTAYGKLAQQGKIPNPLFECLRTPRWRRGGIAVRTFIHYWRVYGEIGVAWMVAKRVLFPAREPYRAPDVA